MNKSVVYARVVPYVCVILALAGVVFYVGHAISENNKPLCRLTVKIEDGKRAGPEVAEEVKAINHDLHCRKLVGNVDK